MSATRPHAETFAALPPVWPEDVLPAIRTLAPVRTLVVLDDDPTGTQTVRDIAVVTTWDVATLRAELAAAPGCFYILTNSRSLDAAASCALHRELAVNLRQAAAEANRAIVVASRSDSTLRGHYPLETDTLAETLGPFDVTLLTPYFEAGGRYTLDDTHYVAEGGRLVPAAETPFARDAAFGYRHSHLPSWVAEKTAGRIHAADVATLSLDEIRRGGPAIVAARLRALSRGTVCIANACAPRDIEVLALATLLAEQAGTRLIYRTAASFVAARIGQEPHAILTPAELVSRGTTGGLVVVGSYVQKTTVQLERLLATRRLHAVELSVAALLDPDRRAHALFDAIAATNTALAAGRDTVVFTSRRLISSPDAAASLAIGRQLSDALIAVVRGLNATPRFLIAKGGITSSDTATRGLDVRRALVCGQLLPGVPVWRLGPESRFPGLDYVVFPGNVGGESALVEAVAKFNPVRTS
jgi:uncharacterized protein YgbK (DUF1537 family)